MYIKFRVKVLLASLVLLLILSHSGNQDQIPVVPAQVSNNNQSPSVLSLVNYTTHDPILIESDSDFETQGWPGNGSVSNPYVIAGLNITSSVTCIRIHDTNAAFIIRDCYIYATEYNRGINFWYINSALIINCTIIGGYGPMIYQSNKVIFENNTMNSLFYPISAFYSIGFQVLNCSFPDGPREGFPQRLELDYCDNARIDGNVFHDLYVSSELSSNVTVTSNNFTEGGILLYWRLSTTFSSSTFRDISGNSVNQKPILYLLGNESSVVEVDDYGQVILVECSNILVQNGNKADTCPVQLFECVGCTIENVTAWRGNTGIYDYGSNFTTIRDCTFIGVVNGGVKMIHCDSSLIENCNSTGVEFFYHDSWFHIQSCTNIIMKQCTIISNRYEAIYFTGADMILTQCTIMGAKFGVHVRGINMTIDNNHIHSMSSQNWQPFYSTGIQAYIVNCTISNNLIENGDDRGIFAETNNSVFVNNTVKYNEGIGIELFNGSTGNLLYGNYMQLNLLGNALDDGFDNQWDNGVSIGNFWHDFNPNFDIQYSIPGDAGSIDHYPISDIIPITNGTTTSTSDPTPTTSDNTTSNSETTQQPIGEIWVVSILILGGIGVTVIIVMIIFLRRRTV